MNTDGTITCNDEKTLENIRPLLIARGWLEAEPENEPADSGALAETYTASVSVSLPVPDWTVPQLINLLRMLCSKQYILNRMMQSDTIHIDEAFIMATIDSPPTNADDFKARIQCASDTDSIRGITFENDNCIFVLPSCLNTPELQKTYLCPQKQELKWKNTDREGKREYWSDSKVCKNCPFREKCIAPSMTRRLVTRHVWQDDLDQADAFTKTHHGRRIYAWRKQTIERSFAEAKELHGLRYARMLGIRNMYEQSFLTAVVQNMKRIAMAFLSSSLPLFFAKTPCLLSKTWRFSAASF